MLLAVQLFHISESQYSHERAQSAFIVELVKHFNDLRDIIIKQIRVFVNYF
jgi:hypothetical protein